MKSPAWWTKRKEADLRPYHDRLPRRGEKGGLE